MTKFMQELRCWHSEELADFRPCSVHVIDQPSMVPSEDEMAESNTSERSYSDGYVMEESEGLELVEPELAEEEPPASDGLEVPMEVEKRELALPSQNLSEEELTCRPQRCVRSPCGRTRTCPAC